MESKFQTSFIPKKPLIPQEGIRVHSHTSVLMIFATIVFVASLAGAAFVFLGKNVLMKSQQNLKRDLVENEKRFNVPLIEELKTANTKIDLANQLLASHMAVSELFKIIGGLTTQEVRFSDFEFSAPETASVGKSFKFSMKGIANSFSTVAFQSDVFGSSEKYGTNKIIKNPILSDISVDPKGNILFNFSAEIDLDNISYAKSIDEISN